MSLLPTREEEAYSQGMSDALAAQGPLVPAPCSVLVEPPTDDECEWIAGILVARNPRFFDGQLDGRQMVKALIGIWLAQRGYSTKPLT